MSRAEPPQLVLAHAHIHERVHFNRRQFSYVAAFTIDGVPDDVQVQLDTGWCVSRDMAIKLMRQMCETFRDKLLFKRVHECVTNLHGTPT